MKRTRTISLIASAAAAMLAFASCGSDDVDVKSVTLSQTALSLKVQEQATLTATVTPSNATDPTVSWTSGNPSVATVNNGVVTAVSAGTSTITASAQDGTVSASCLVTVSNWTAESVTVSAEGLSGNAATLERGSTLKLNVTVLPELTANKNVTYTSSDQSVVTVSADGTVTAVGPGTATVTVTTVEGGVSTTLNFTVIVSVAGVSLEQNLRIAKGTPYTLSAVFTPADCQNKNVTWTTSDANVVAITPGDNGTVSLLGLAESTATITVTTQEGNFTATTNVTVFDYHAESVTLSESAPFTLEKGSTKTLTAIVSPDNAVDKTVAWTSSNPAVATVDANGVVTAVSSGTATITATTNDGGHTASVTVTVHSPVTSVSASETALSIAAGYSKTFTVTINPTDASDPSFTVTSSDESVAKVSFDGTVITVSGVGAGSATVTVRTTDGGHTATVAVSVTDTGTQMPGDNYGDYK